MIFYTDKSEIFECNVNVEGASLENTKAMLVVESKNWNLIFYGDIERGGKCKIEIGKLSILKEGETGKMRLEVIADDTYFIPWEGDFEVKTNKKVTVEVISNNKNSLSESNKPKVSVSKIEEKKEVKIVAKGNKTDCLNEVIKKIKQSNITSQNLSNNKLLIKKIVTETVSSYNLINDKDDVEWLVGRTLDFFEKQL